MAKTFIMSLYKSSRWCKLLFLILIIMIFFVGISHYSKREGFINQTQKFSLIKGPSIFDEFYSTVYDDIITDNVKDEYQIGTIINKTGPTNKSLVLDIGSGTGNIVNLFNEKNINAIGLDKSASMVNIAKSKFPNLTFNQGDATNIMLYPAHSFTHITCLNDTIHYIKNKNSLIKNIYEWLIPGGYFIVAVNTSEDFSPSKNNKSLFNTFTYKSSTENVDGHIVFSEIFKDNNNKIRKQEHKLYVNDNVVKIAQDNGFVIESKYNLSPVGYQDKQLYIFYKPE
jgi:ubiquinone/menaquinone biosynthesis C-methylase UbiE